MQKTIKLNSGNEVFLDDIYSTGSKIQWRIRSHHKLRDDEIETIIEKIYPSAGYGASTRTEQILEDWFHVTYVTSWNSCD